MRLSRRSGNIGGSRLKISLIALRIPVTEPLIFPSNVKLILTVVEENVHLQLASVIGHIFHVKGYHCMVFLITHESDKYHYYNFCLTLLSFNW